MEDLKEVFSKNLRIALNAENMTQKELAEKSGLTDVSVNRYYHGKRLPSLEAFVAILNALGGYSADGMLNLNDDI